MISEHIEFIPHYETSGIPPDVDCLPVWAFPHLYLDKWYPGKEEENILLRGQDSNLRPQDYESCILPLNYPAILQTENIR